MTDIVERLHIWPTVEVASVVERKLMSEAADEIERLRVLATKLAHYADGHGLTGKWADELRQLKDQI